MLLFTGIKERVIIPLSRVYNICSSENRIIINYNCGDLINVEGNCVPKIETVRVILDSSDEVDKTIRQFYKACQSNAKAFFFGGL